MLLKISTVVTAMVLCGSLAQARSVLGSWSGVLTYSYLDDVQSENCTTENTISQEASTVTFKQVCSCYGQLEVTLDSNGTELLSNGQVVGSLTEDAFIFNDVALSSGDTYSVSLTVNADGTANFQDRFNYGGNPEDYDSVSGSMKPTEAIPSIFSINRNTKIRRLTH